MFVLIHTISSIFALLIGTWSIFQTKGTKLHKLLGWIFVSSMLLSACSSFLIYNKRLSIIHILSFCVLFWLFKAVHAVRLKPKNWVYIHASSIGAAYIATIIAGSGVLVRKILLPGNNNAGYLASIFTAVLSVYILDKLTKKLSYKTHE